MAETTGFITQYGLDIDKLFFKGEGHQALGLYDYTGMDIGQRFQKGRTGLRTMIHGANGGDIADVLGGRDFGIYRVPSWPWCGHCVRGDYNANNHTKYWTDKLTSWMNGGGGDWKKVDGITNDSYCTETHSDNGYSTVVFAMSPFDTAAVDFKCEKISERRWHNSWCTLIINPIEIKPWLKGFALYPHSGAGGGFHAQVRFTATCPGQGTLVYEGLFGHHHDSNHPYYAKYAYNENDFGKQWVFHS